MSNINHPVFYALLMVVAGFGIPMMATLNASLGEKVQNPALATVVLLSVGLTAAICVLFVSRDPITSPFRASTPFYYYFAGLLFVFYISTITWVVPKFGVGNAIAFILLGQLIAITLIDHFSLFNAINYRLTWQRLFGLLMMMGGIYLVVKNNN